MVFSFDMVQGGSDEWVWGVKSHIFGICQKVFFRHKNENGFLSKLRGWEGVRAILTFVKKKLVFFLKASLSFLSFCIYMGPDIDNMKNSC